MGIWKTIPLGELCRIELGRTPSRSDKKLWDQDKKTQNVWVSIADIPQHMNASITESKEYISDEGARKGKLVKEGTLLVSFKLTLGRLAYAGRDLFTNEAIASLSILNQQEISKAYLYWYLTFFDWQEAAAGSHKVKGKTLNKAKLKVLPVSLPPLPEQKRIVEILDEAFAAIDKATANTEKNIKNAEELYQSKLNHLFLRGSQNWPSIRFKEACLFVRGPFGGSLKKSCFTEQGYAVYEQRHAIHQDFKAIRYFVPEAKYREMKRFQLHPEELIMSCSGTMGKVAIVPETASAGVINQALLKLTPAPELVNQFLLLWMNSKDFLDQLDIHSRGAAIKNLASVRVLKEIELPLPSVQIQQEAISATLEIRQATDLLRESFKLKRLSLSELKQSILHKAFTGELTSDFKAVDKALSEAGV